MKHIVLPSIDMVDACFNNIAFEKSLIMDVFLSS